MAKSYGRKKNTLAASLLLGAVGLAVGIAGTDARPVNSTTSNATSATNSTQMRLYSTNTLQSLDASSMSTSEGTSSDVPNTQLAKNFDGDSLSDSGIQSIGLISNIDTDGDASFDKPNTQTTSSGESNNQDISNNVDVFNAADSPDDSASSSQGVSQPQIMNVAADDNIELEPTTEFVPSYTTRDGVWYTDTDYTTFSLPPFTDTLVPEIPTDPTDLITTTATTTVIFTPPTQGPDPTTEATTAEETTAEETTTSTTSFIIPPFTDTLVPEIPTDPTTTEETTAEETTTSTATTVIFTPPTQGPDPTTEETTAEETTTSTTTTVIFTPPTQGPDPTTETTTAEETTTSSEGPIPTSTKTTKTTRAVTKTSHNPPTKTPHWPQNFPIHHPPFPQYCNIKYPPTRFNNYHGESIRKRNKDVDCHDVVLYNATVQVADLTLTFVKEYNCTSWFEAIVYMERK